MVATDVWPCHSRVEKSGQALNLEHVKVLV